LKAPQLIHRYKSRALFTPTSVCPIHCRYCFRRNELQSNEDLFQNNFEKTLDYIHQHPEISEIIFTGGDPLTISNEKMARYLERFSEIKTLRDIRFHSRYPVILPERIDDEFLALLTFYSKKFRTLSLAIHANHTDEFDHESIHKIRLLAQSPVQLLSQTVLLKGVNDRVEDLVSLIHLFMDLKIRPYYLHHPDQVKGGIHFYISIEEGRKLYSQLRDQLPGWSIPHYVIDIPHGPGKVNAFNPEQFEFSGQLIGKNGATNVHAEPDSIGF
jgi:lysine 2,3-aminomutase